MGQILKRIKEGIKSELSEAQQYMISDKGQREIERAGYSGLAAAPGFAAMAGITYDYTARFLNFILTNNRSFIPTGIDPATFVGVPIIFASATAVVYLNRNEIKGQFIEGVNEMKGLKRDLTGFAKGIVHQARRLC